MKTVFVIACILAGIVSIGIFFFGMSFTNNSRHWFEAAIMAGVALLVQAAILGLAYYFLTKGSQKIFLAVVGLACVPFVFGALSLFQIRVYEPYVKNHKMDGPVALVLNSTTEEQKLFSLGALVQGFSGNSISDDNKQQLLNALQSVKPEAIQSSKILQTLLTSASPVTNRSSETEFFAKVYVLLKNKSKPDFLGHSFFLDMNDRVTTRIAEIGLEDWRNEIAEENPLFAKVPFSITQFDLEADVNAAPIDKKLKTSNTLGSFLLYTVALSYLDISERKDAHEKETLPPKLKFLQSQGFEYTTSEKADRSLQDFLKTL